MARKHVVFVGILVSALILGWLVVGRLGALERVAGHIDWPFVAAGVGCAFLSYVFIGLALWEVLGLLGYHLSFPEVLGIAFVSTTANYFVSSLGVSGFALKAHLLRKRHVPYGATVTASVISTSLMYFVLGVIILQGLVYMLLRMQGARIQILEGVLGLGILGVTSTPLLLFILNRDLRGRLTRTVFGWINHGVFFFSRREIPKEDFEHFERQLNVGLESIRRGSGRLTVAIGYTCLDWALTMMVLFFGFKAVGETLSVGHLTTGFAVGQATTLIPFLPGGLGAMEGSMAAVFEGLGVDWDSAMVAVLLYRASYYFLPGLASVFLLWGLKVSEPALIEETVSESLPEELKIQAEELERRRAPRS